MKIDIYMKITQFAAVKHGAIAPAGGWKFFKTIDLQPGSVLIGGPKNPRAVLEAIERDGIADI